MSRVGVDVITGAGLDAPLSGVEVIVDATSGPSPDQQEQGDVAYLPNMRTQLVAARTVAEVLADVVAEGDLPPTGGWPVVEIAGPREENLVDAAMLLAARRGRPLKIEAVSDPGNPEAQLMETGALLPGPSARLEGPTFEKWLETDTETLS